MRTRQALREDIQTCGYFPDLVHDAVEMAVAEEDIVDFVVHHEPTFSRDQIHRHVTILVLTPTRLVVGHTDDHHADPAITPEPVAGVEPGTGGVQASTSTESVPLRSIDTVTLTRVVTDPAAYSRDGVAETWLTVTWGAMRRVDLEPADCADPACEADHGYSGTLVGDDLVVRMSAAADGRDQVERLVRFATTLQRVTR